MDKHKFPKKPVGEILVEEGLLDARDLKEGLEIQKKEGGLIGAILVKKGCLSEEGLIAALSKQLNIPFIRLNRYNVNRNALKLIPKEVAARFLIFPFEEIAGTMCFAMAEPQNGEALSAIEKRIPSRVDIFLATPSDIQEAIELYYAGEGAEAEEAERR